MYRIYIYYCYLLIYNYLRFNFFPASLSLLLSHVLVMPNAAKETNWHMTHLLYSYTVWYFSNISTKWILFSPVVRVVIFMMTGFACSFCWQRPGYEPFASLILLFIYKFMKTHGKLKRNVFVKKTFPLPAYLVCFTRFLHLKLPFQLFQFVFTIFLHVHTGRLWNFETEIVFLKIESEVQSGDPQHCYGNVNIDESGSWPNNINNLMYSSWFFCTPFFSFSLFNSLSTIYCIFC